MADHSTPTIVPAHTPPRHCGPTTHPAHATRGYSPWSFRRLTNGLLLLLILAGCADAVAPARPLATTDSADHPAIAIESSGQRHVVWQECAQRCTLQYERSALGKLPVRIALVPPADQTVGRPDVAVTSAGDAILLWEQLSLSPPVQVAVYTARIPAGSTAVPGRQALSIPARVLVNGDRPRLIARDTTVYATYLKANQIGAELYQQRVAPAVEPAMQITAGLPETPVAVALQIDSLNRLHLAYKIVVDGSAFHRLHYKGPTTAAHLLAEGTGVAGFSAPDLELDSADTAYVTYNDQTPPVSDRVTVFRRRADGATTTFQLLPPLDPTAWGVLFQPDAVVIGSALEISFTARHGAIIPDPTPRATVWHTSMNLTNGVVQTPRRISRPSPLTPVNPQIIKVAETAVILWQDGSFTPSPCQLDGYSWDIAHGVRKIHHRNPAGGCFVSQLDVAVANDWVAGVIRDRHPTQPLKPAPWLAFNAYGTYIPRVTR